MGISVRRVMTDGAWAYTHNRAFAALLAERGIRHIVTRPYTPRTNGKVCVSGWCCRPVGRRGSPRLLV